MEPGVPMIMLEEEEEQPVEEPVEEPVKRKTGDAWGKLMGYEYKPKEYNEGLMSYGEVVQKERQEEIIENREEEEEEEELMEIDKGEEQVE